IGEPLDNRCKIEEAVGDVEGDDAVRLDVAQVHCERLAGEQMDRDRVAGNASMASTSNRWPSSRSRLSRASPRTMSILALLSARKVNSCCAMSMTAGLMS